MCVCVCGCVCMCENLSSGLGCDGRLCVRAPCLRRWLRVHMCVLVHMFVLYIAYLSSVVVQAAVGGDFRVVCARACHLYGGAGCWRVRSRS